MKSTHVRQIKRQLNPVEWRYTLRFMFRQWLHWRRFDKELRQINRSIYKLLSEPSVNFTRRKRLEAAAVEWCKVNQVPITPFNVITALSVLGEIGVMSVNRSDAAVYETRSDEASIPSSDADSVRDGNENHLADQVSLNPSPSSLEQKQ